MSSKILKLSFPEEDLDVYSLLKSKAHPSRFVIEAIRYYQLHRSAQSRVKKSQIQRTDIEDIVNSVLDEKLQNLPKQSINISEITSSVKMKRLISAIVKEELQNCQVTSVVVEEDKEESVTSEVGKVNLSALEDTSKFDFSAALAAFDD